MLTAFITLLTHSEKILAEPELSKIESPNEQEKRKLYFVHIQKTGGTTLRLLLEQQVSSQEIYPFRNFIEAKPPITHDIVSGHLPVWLCKQLDPHFDSAFKVTILRDPVERYLSYLRFRKKTHVEFKSMEAVFASRCSKKQAWQFSLIDNAMCRNLSDDRSLEGKALLERAKQMLDQFDHVIFFEQFDEGIIDLFHCLGITLDKSEIPHVNRSEKEPVKQKLLQSVKQLNELDQQLYTYAKEHWKKKNTTHQLRGSSFEQLLKPTSVIDYSFDQPLNGKGWSYRGESTKEKTYKIYRWVTDKPAYIYFPLEEGHDYDFYFYARPLVTEVDPKVKVNGQELTVTQLNNAHFSLYHAFIPKQLIVNKKTEIMFYGLKAFDFWDIMPERRNPNHPPCAFMMNRIHIENCDNHNSQR